MSAAVDANLLLYASDSTSPYHEPASNRLGQLAAGPEIVYLFWPVVMAYLQISTHPRNFRRFAGITPRDPLAKEG